MLKGGYIALDEYPKGGPRAHFVDSKTGDERVIAPDAPAGHISGDSGRFGAVEEAALINAFLLDQAGMNPGNKTASN